MSKFIVYSLKDDFSAGLDGQVLEEAIGHDSAFDANTYDCVYQNKDRIRVCFKKDMIDEEREGLDLIIQNHIPTTRKSKMLTEMIDDDVYITKKDLQFGYIIVNPQIEDRVYTMSAASSDCEFYIINKGAYEVTLSGNKIVGSAIIYPETSAHFKCAESLLLRLT